MDYPNGPNVITRVLIDGRKKSESERFEDVTLLALKMEEGAMCQGMQTALH